MVSSQAYNAPVKDILLAKELAFEIGVQVGNKGVSNNSEGRKIIPAGTPIGGLTSALDDRKAILTVTTGGSDGVNAQGVLRYDVDVTAGNANGTMVVCGVVDTSKCPSTLDTNAKTALKRIIFVNGGKN